MKLCLSVFKSLKCYSLICLLLVVLGCNQSQESKIKPIIEKCLDNNDYNISIIDSLIAENGQTDYLCGMKVYFLSYYSTDSAISYYDNLSIDKGTYLDFAYGITFLYNYNFSEALNCFQNSVDKDKSNENYLVYINWAYLLFDIGASFDEVNELITKAKKIAPESPQLLYAEAELNIFYGNFKKADELINTGNMKLKPYSSEILNGIFNSNLKRINKAEANFLNALDLSKNNSDSFNVYSYLFYVYLTDKQYDKADSLYLDFLQFKKDNINVIYGWLLLNEDVVGKSDLLKAYREMFSYSVQPIYLLEYVELALIVEDPLKVLDDFRIYKSEIDKLFFVNYMYLIDITEILIYKHAGLPEYESLNAIFNEIYGPEEFRIKNEILRKNPKR